MPLNSDRRITTPVPFPQDRTVLYLGGRADCAALAGRVRRAGYKFIFLPELADSLGPSVLGYLCPGSEGQASAEAMSRRIRELAGLEDGEGFLYRRDGITRFHAVPAAPGGSLEAALGRWIDALDERPAPKARSIHFRKERASREEDFANFGGGGVFDLDFSCEALRTPASEVEESLDARTQQILRAWEQIEREFGITIEDLDIILGYRVQLSRLSITPAGRIFLMDWTGRPEVRMDDLTKALYFFYLRHPEGVALKELTSYREEILHYYAGITGRDDPKAIAESVDKLLSPFDNNLNVSISRIKKAFKDLVGERVARFYYVSGRYAETRRVVLDRDLVIWEH